MTRVISKVLQAFYTTCLRREELFYLMLHQSVFLQVDTYLPILPITLSQWCSTNLILLCFHISSSKASVPQCLSQSQRSNAYIAFEQSPDRFRWPQVTSSVPNFSSSHASPGTCSRTKPAKVWKPCRLQGRLVFFSNHCDQARRMWAGWTTRPSPLFSTIERSRWKQ